MKRSIRNGVFETNSSSVHTITIVDKSDVTKYPETVEADSIGDFGWGANIYTSMQAKLNYLWLAIQYYPFYGDWRNKLPIEEQLKVAENLRDKFISSMESLGVEVILDNPKAVITSFTPGDTDYQFVAFVPENYDPETTKYYKDGYIDHGNECQDFVDDVLNDTDLLARYLFDANSYIITGNDNDDDYLTPPNDLPATEYVKGN